MGSNRVTINDMLKFKVDDSVMDKLIKLLVVSDDSALILDCPNCGLTVVPQARAAYWGNKKEEQEIMCVGCSKMVSVRMYSNYGFIIPDNASLDSRILVEN